MNESGVEDIARELYDLLDQQMKALSGQGFQDMPDEGLADYERRRIRIATLRSELAQFARKS
jgi:hypothetical protein